MTSDCSICGVVVGDANLHLVFHEKHGQTPIHLVRDLKNTDTVVSFSNGSLFGVNNFAILSENPKGEDQYEMLSVIHWIDLKTCVVTRGVHGTNVYNHTVEAEIR